MPIQTKLTISTSDFQKGLKNAENQAKSAFNSMSNGTQAAQRAIDGLGRSATSSLGKAGSAVQGMTSALSKMGPVGLAVAGVFAGVALAIGGAYKGLTSLSERLDRVAKDAKSIGMSFNGMLGVKFASGRAGSDLNRTIEGIQRISEAWDKATKGEAKYLRMFRELGVDMTKDWTQAPERLYGAVTTALAGGRRSSVLEDLMGRRGMRTLSKNAANGFERDLDLARTVGLNIPQSAVDAAERLTTAQGQLSDGFMALLAKTEALTKGMDALGKFEERLMASTLAGKPLGPDSGSENIYDIINRARESGQLTREMYINALVRQGNHTVSYAEQAAAGRIQLNSLDAAKLAAQIDSRIDPSKQESWVQTRVQTDTEKAEIDRKNAIVEAEALIRAGANLDEQLNRLKHEQIELTQEENDRLREASREALSARWETVAGQAWRDKNALSAASAKESLKKDYAIPDEVLKYIEQYAEGLLGEGGLVKLLAMHGGTTRGFYEAYSQERLFTPIAEQALSNQTRGFMSSNNLSLNEEGIRAAEELQKAQMAAAKATEADVAQTREKIKTNANEIAKLDAERAELREDIDSSKTSSRVLKELISGIITIGSIRGNGAPFDINPGLTAEEIEKAKASSNKYDKEVDIKGNEFVDNLAKAVDLTEANKVLEEEAQKGEEAAAAQLKAAEDMAKAADEMRKYVEFSNIDRELQARLREAEAVELGKMLNSQVDLRKAAQGQYAIDNAAFNYMGNGMKIAEAQAVAMMEDAGLKVTESSLKQLTDDIYKAQNEQRQVGIQRTMQSQFYANEDFAMSQFGPRGAGMKAVADAVRQFGDALTQEQKDLIGRSAELKAMSSQNRELQRTGTQILTNDLTSRGGFRTGAVRTGHDNLQSVLENQKQQLQIFRQMDATNRRIEQLLTM